MAEQTEEEIEEATALEVEALGHCVMSAIAWHMGIPMDRHNEHFESACAKVRLAAGMFGLEISEDAFDA